MIKIGTSPKAFMYKKDILVWPKPKINQTARIINTDIGTFIKTGEEYNGEEYFCLEEMSEEERMSLLWDGESAAQAGVSQMDLDHDRENVYFPLAKPNLWKEFLDTNKEPALIRAFILKYGPLYINKENYNLIDLNDYTPVFLHIKKFETAWNRYCANQKNIDAKGRYYETLPHPGLNDDDDGRLYLMDTINNILKDSSITPYIDLDNKGKPHLHFKPKNLADALLLQIMHFFLNGKSHVRRCLARRCTKNFIAQRSTRKYCSNACRQYEYDYKKKNKHENQDAIIWTW